MFARGTAWSAVIGGSAMRGIARAAATAVAAYWLLAGCNGSSSTGSSNPTTIADLQARTLQRPLDDRPVQLEIVVMVSNPQEVVGGEGRLRRLRAAEDTCQAPGVSPIVATAPITPANLDGNRLRVVMSPRLPAGRSRLCFFVALPDNLASKVRRDALAEIPAGQTNELDLGLEVFPAQSGEGSPSAPSGGGSSSPAAGGESSSPAAAPPAPTPTGPPKSPPLPVVTITASDASAAESPLDPGTFRLSRTGSTTTALAVFFSVGGTATSGSDYGAIGTSVVIPAGSATADITVTPINDSAGEDPETVTVTLGANARYRVGSPSNATVTITSEDTEVRGSGSAGGSRGPEGNVLCPASSIPTTSACPVTCPGTFDGTIFQITVIRTGSTAAPLDLFYELSGTASVNFDYFFRPQRQPPGQPNQRILTFPAGASETKLCVITVANTAHEAAPEETVTLSILPGAGYTIGSPSSGTVTIVEDD